MSIVLVIVGLIIGSIMVGRTLIKASEIRATVRQYEQFKAAITAFRLKYNALPGDIKRSDAAQFGFVCSPSNYATTCDGDGLIRQCPYDALNEPNGETLLFWRHLVDAKLINGSYSAQFVTNTGAYPGADGYTGNYTAGDFFPYNNSLGKGYWLPGSSDGVNYLVLAGVTSVASNGSSYSYNSAKGLTPYEASGIDIKLDDGMPNTGTIQARPNFSGQGNFIYGTPDIVFTALSAGTASAFATTPVAGTCQTGGSGSTDTSNTYAIGSIPTDRTACNLRLTFN